MAHCNLEFFGTLGRIGKSAHLGQELLLNLILNLNLNLNLILILNLSEAETGDDNFGLVIRVGRRLSSEY